MLGILFNEIAESVAMCSEMLFQNIPYKTPDVQTLVFATQTAYDRLYLLVMVI